MRAGQPGYGPPAVPGDDGTGAAAHPQAGALGISIARGRRAAADVDDPPSAVYEMLRAARMPVAFGTTVR
jgi:hypothetical protein